MNVESRTRLRERNSTIFITRAYRVTDYRTKPTSYTLKSLPDASLFEFGVSKESQITGLSSVTANTEL